MDKEGTNGTKNNSFSGHPAPVVTAMNYKKRGREIGAPLSAVRPQD
jgi:hypothetical protein